MYSTVLPMATIRRTLRNLAAIIIRWASRLYARRLQPSLLPPSTPPSRPCHRQATADLGIPSCCWPVSQLADKMVGGVSSSSRLVTTCSGQRWTGHEAWEGWGGWMFGLLPHCRPLPPPRLSECYTQSINYYGKSLNWVDEGGGRVGLEEGGGRVGEGWRRVVVGGERGRVPGSKIWGKCFLN